MFHFKRFFCRVILALFVVGVSACASAPRDKVVEPPVDTASSGRYVERLLVAAERALAADRLMLPAHDNAYDRFQAVLLLKPQESQALSGLQLVALRYVALARDAAARARYVEAQDLLLKAQRVGKDSSRLLTMVKTLSSEVAVRQQEIAAPSSLNGSMNGVVSDNTNEHEFYLSEDGLRRQDETVAARLTEIAQRMQRGGETMLIVARSDAEGRWIYRQMKQAAPGFRLRGDIKVGKRPKVVLLSPIE